MDLFTFSYEDKVPEKQPRVDIQLPTVGDPVEIPSIGITGTVEYIDKPTLYTDAYQPIQVRLDWEHDNQWMWRTNLKDITIL